MINPDIFAYMATIINIVMLFPQVLQTWKTKHTKDLSSITLLLFFSACILWILYGVAKSALPIILANTVVGALNLFLFILKLKYPGKPA